MIFLALAVLRPWLFTENDVRGMEMQAHLAIPLGTLVLVLWTASLCDKQTQPSSEKKKAYYYSMHTSSAKHALTKLAVRG
jgi:hypothetical protein